MSSRAGELRGAGKDWGVRQEGSRRRAGKGDRRRRSRRQVGEESRKISKTRLGQQAARSGEK